MTRPSATPGGPDTTASPRRRRAAGWGFEGEELTPSSRLLAWLEDRLGPFEASAPPRPEAAVTGIPSGRLDDLELPGTVSRDPADRLAHARGQGLPDLLRLRAGRVPAVPDAVARVAPGEVEGLLRACAEVGARVLPRGGGTSVTGGVNVLAGDPPTVVLDVTPWSGLTAWDETSRLATFGAGTAGPAVEAALAGLGSPGTPGFTLGHFPQSWELSTVGGWVATRASGQESMGYGRIEDLTAGMTLVAPAGRLTVPPLPAAAQGPDPRQLLLGSEGRFGVLTDVTLRVRPRPEATDVEAWLLPDWDTGLEAARRLTQERVPLTLLRLSDEAETEVALSVGLAGKAWVERLLTGWWKWKGVAGGCLLLLGWAGSEDEREHARARVGSVLGGFRVAALGAGPGRSWKHDRFRHPYLRDALLDRGVATDTLETAAPWARLPELARAVITALEGGETPAAALCHVSHPYPDGASLYFTFFFPTVADADGGLDATLERWAALKRAATDALAPHGGALSHHHGVGRWHAPWLPRHLDDPGVAALTAVAGALDPHGVCPPTVLPGGDDRLED